MGNASIKVADDPVGRGARPARWPTKKLLGRTYLCPFGSSELLLKDMLKLAAKLCDIQVGLDIEARRFGWKIG